MRTMKVKPWGKDQGDHVIINEDDYDPKVHKKFTVRKKVSKKKVSRKKA